MLECVAFKEGKILETFYIYTLMHCSDSCLKCLHETFNQI